MPAPLSIGSRDLEVLKEKIAISIQLIIFLRKQTSLIKAFVRT